jgi:hypothetical protein
VDGKPPKERKDKWDFAKVAMFTRAKNCLPEGDGLVVKTQKGGGQNLLFLL